MGHFAIQKNWYSLTLGLDLILPPKILNAGDAFFSTA